MCGFASIRSAFLTRSRPLALGSERASSSCDGGRLRSETSSFPHVCAWNTCCFWMSTRRVVRRPRDSRRYACGDQTKRAFSDFAACPFRGSKAKSPRLFGLAFFEKSRTLSGLFRTVSERFGPFAKSPGLIAFRAYFRAATSRRRRLPAGLGVLGLAISGNFHRRPKRNFRLRRGSQATPSLDAETCPASPSVFAGLWLSDAGMATAATRAPEHMRTRAAAAKHATARSRHLGRAVALRMSKGRKPLSVGGENGSKRTGTFYFRGGQT